MTVAQETKAPAVAPAGRLKDKVALVTGGSRGIGLAVAKAYVREGARVFIAARTSDEIKIALGELKALGGTATAARMDLTSEENCRALYLGVLREFGKIDILVNNAGMLGPQLPILQYPTDDWNEVMTTNLNSVFWLSKFVLSTMISSNHGSIINVTSGVAEQGRANWGAYAVSKAAVVNLSQVMADEVSKYNIRVNCINPGPTRTMMRAEAMPKENPEVLPAPEEIVNPFIYLASDVSRGVTGATFDCRDWMGRSF